MEIKNRASVNSVLACGLAPSAASPSNEQRYTDAPAHTRDSSGKLPFHERRYFDGVHSFETGDLPSALEAFSEYLRLTNQAALIDSNSAPYGLADIHSYEEFERSFRNLLDQRSKSWGQAAEPYPRFLRSLARVLPTEIPARGKRILFLIPQHVTNSKRFIEADFKDHLLESAANAGAEVEFFPTDRCSYPGKDFDVARAKTELGLLSVKIATFRPDVILVDGNYVPSAESLNPAWLNDLKARLGFRVIVFIGDAWGSHWIPAANSWSDVGDVIFHFAPETPLEKQGRFSEKLCWDAYPVNERNFFRDPNKNFDISFVGTYVSVLRPFWLTVALQVAKDQNLNHQLLPHKREASIALTMDEYATVLRQSKMVLNFSTRVGHSKTMTGRAWQAITAGTVLLEEDNVFTSAYFVPFVHYVPFSTRDELAYVIRFFSRNPDDARRIGEAASAFRRERYSSEAIWSRLLGAAYAHMAQRSGGIRD